GRGSAPSFIITNLLGLTEIDRLNAPVPLFPTRFMSVERILSAKSLPDIDLNAEDAEPFIQATRDLLGEENCAWMISYKPLQDAS
ncbi:DNA polymerase III subunit alpha, partial [Clostridioides sp. ES-S-0049-03]|nr:DNA polymerase III subunit alpha [Clostridioides sp. ES-S-0049-03]